MLLYLLYKLARGDFWYFVRVEGSAGVVTAFFTRVLVKVIADFSGCVHLRHPLELGGMAFSMSMLWAQIFPFVALIFYEDDGNKETNVVFFCTIDTSYLDTFFGTKTAPQHTCELFLSSEEDSEKFRAAFKKRQSFTTSINEEIKEWVAANITRWKTEKPSWFKIELIPDSFLPEAALEAEGGARNRRRSSMSLREVVGLE